MDIRTTPTCEWQMNNLDFTMMKFDDLREVPCED